MKIKVISAFNDSENKYITRNVGDEFETDDKRGKSLIDRGFAEEIKAKTSKTAE